MKNSLLISLIFLLFACSPPSSEADDLFQLAKKHTIEKLELPEGTQFNENLVTIKKFEENGEAENELFSVTLVLPVRNENGKVSERTHVLLFKKNQQSEDLYELLSFE